MNRRTMYPYTIYTMFNEICMYIVGFGFSDLIIRVGKIQSITGLFFYYLCILILSFLFFRYFNHDGCSCKSCSESSTPQCKCKNAHREGFLGRLIDDVGGS